MITFAFLRQFDHPYLLGGMVETNSRGKPNHAARLFNKGRKRWWIFLPKMWRHNNHQRRVYRKGKLYEEG